MEMINEADGSFIIYKRNILKDIVKLVTLGFMCFFPFFILFYSIVLKANIFIILLSFIVTIMTNVATTYYWCSKTRRREINEAKKVIRESNYSCDTILSSCLKLGRKEKNRIGLKKETNKDSGWRILNYPTIGVITTIFFILSMLVSIYVYTEKSYWVFTSNDETFVSVLESGDRIILKRAEIDYGNNNVRIYLNKQLEIQSIGANMERITFDNVEIYR